MCRHRIVFAGVGVVAVAVRWLALAGVVAAQPLTLTINPDRVLRGTSPTVTITAETLPEPQELLPGKPVRVGGQDVGATGQKGTLTVTLPKLDIVGSAAVEVIDKTGKTVATGQVFYVDSAAPMPTPTSESAVLLVFYVALIVAFPWSLTLTDIGRGYRAQRNMRNEVIAKLADHLTVDERKVLIAQMEQGPPGTTGLTRGALALTLLLILGIAIFHITVLAPNSSVPLSVEKLLTLLAGAFTSITGFYFGTRASEGGQQASSRLTPMTPPSGGTVPTITGVTPPSGGVGAEVRLTGQGFGTSGTVTLGNVDATPSSWTDTSIRVNVPPGVTQGPTQIIVKSELGTSPPFAFVVSSPMTPPSGGTVPTITGVTPLSGGVGAEVRLTGQGFGTSGTVTFGNVDATPSSWTDTSIRVNVPPGVTQGPTQIIVKSELGTSLPFDFVVSSPMTPPSGGTVPTITGATPPSGGVGVEVELAGQGVRDDIGRG